MVRDDPLRPWTLYRHGSATVSVGQPFYGRPRIVANAPCSAEGFDDLTTVIAEARRVYEQERGL